ncbi:IS110 family transposase [Nocardioides daeguensis]|uniref:IS110 family transposase n=1 Tax=Nocardioides daeguensis TaxID=908359 RepID=A0ABP6UTZ1_9ACTN|nr:IS110 family transposase [Nocardioides daeguensis]MBV6728187.1 IS110 family transposase [Nocardioides daeguensis]MCR1772997.1 IS110 family transposase [Nocardioides daeguensis]
MYAGIDTHKDTLAVAVTDPTGLLVASHQFPNTTSGFTELTRLLSDHQVQRVGIEGSGAYGRAVAVHLALEHPDEQLNVVEVPTLMTSRERRSKPGQGKTDPVDALAIARITAREPALPPVRLTVGPAADMRALLDYRDELIAERTALANRVHAELAGLLPGYQHQIGSLTTRARIDRATELLAQIAGHGAVRADLARRRLERIVAIDTEASQLRKTIADLVEDTGTTLTEEYGIGPLIAARFIAEVVDVRRYPNRDTFAAANGTAPIPASSGRTVRHRFNPGGNRQLNRALYTIAITQIRADTEGRRYYETKRAQGKTRREALRCLKRRLSDVVYRRMRNDAAGMNNVDQWASVGLNGQQREPLAVDAGDANEARLTA